jgi:DNA-binding NarL/FixJ family response regulator
MCKIDLTKLDNYQTLRAEDKKIVQLLVEGKSNKEICLNLDLGEKKLEKQLSNIYLHLGIEKAKKEKRVSLFVKILASMG